MKSIFDFDARASDALVGGNTATAAAGLPVPGGYPGTFAPGASNDSANALARMRAKTTAMLGEVAPKPTRAAQVGYNPTTKQFFSGGKTFAADLDEGRAAAAAGLLDMDNPELPEGFTPVFAEDAKAKLAKDYRGQDIVDDFQRRVGQFGAGVGSAARDLRIPGAQAFEESGAALARRNPSQINTGQDILDQPVTTAREAIGEATFDLGKAAAGAAGGAAAGAALGSVVPGVGTALGAILGGAGGMFLPTLFETYGSIRRDQREQGIEDKTRAGMAAAGSAALETALGPEAAVGRIAKRVATRSGLQGAVDLTKSGAARQVGKDMAVGAVVEGPLTEVPQSAIERWGAHQDLTGQQALDEYLIGAVKGGIGGGAITSVTSTVEYTQAKNFLDNYMADRAKAADPTLPSAQRLASARRVQDVLNGESNDPAFSQQLGEFRQILARVEQQLVTNATREALDTGAPVDLLSIRAVGQEAQKLPALQDSPFGNTEQQRTFEAGVEALPGAMDESREERIMNVGAANRERLMQDAEGLRAAQGPGAAWQEMQAAQQGGLAAAETAGAQFDDVMSGNMETALEDPRKFRGYLDSQNAALGAEPGVASAIDPAGPAPSTSLLPQEPAPFSVIPGTIDSVSQTGGLPSNEAVANAPGLLSSDAPASEDLFAGDDSPITAAEVAAAIAATRKLNATALSEPGRAAGRVTLPQGVLNGVMRALRASGNAPLVAYMPKSTQVDKAATQQYQPQMRAIVDASRKVAEAMYALRNAESNLNPSDERSKPRKGMTTDETATLVASEAMDGKGSKPGLRELQVRVANAVDELKTAAGSERNVEAVVAVLKSRVQKIESKKASQAKSDTRLDAMLSQAWAMYKDGALDNPERLDVVRGRPIRESFEQIAKGATEPPLTTAATEGYTRRVVRKRKGETDAAREAREQAAKETGVLGVLAYLQRHGTGFERLLAASVARTLRRPGLPAPSIEWIEDGAVPFYNPKTNTVGVHKTASPEEILHETLHAALQWYVYQNPASAEVKALSASLQKVLNYKGALTPKQEEVIAVLRKVRAGRSKTAELDAVLELVSYGSTLAEFRALLKALPSDSADGGFFAGITDLWARVTALVQRMLGVSKTVANDVLDASVALLEQAADPETPGPGGKGKGNILRAEVTSGTSMPADPGRAATNPYQAQMSAEDYTKFSKGVLPEWVSRFVTTRWAFDALRWGKVMTALDEKVVGRVSKFVQENSPGVSRMVSWVNSHYGLPALGKESVANLLVQAKDERRGGSAVFEAMGQYFTMLPADKSVQVLTYMDERLKFLRGQQAEPKFPLDDNKLRGLADTTIDMWWQYATNLKNEQQRDAYAGRKVGNRWVGGVQFSQGLVFARTTSDLASRSFGSRKISELISSRTKVEETADAIRMRATVDGDPILTDTFVGLYVQGPALDRRMANGETLSTIPPDEFISAELLQSQGMPGDKPFIADPAYLWKLEARGKNGYRMTARLDAKQALQAKQGHDLAMALQNTMAILANSYSADNFADRLVDFGREDGAATIHSVAFESLDELNASLHGAYDARGNFVPQVDPSRWDRRVTADAVIKLGDDMARAETVQGLYRSADRWVLVPKSPTYGAMAGKIVSGPVWSAVEDMSDRRPLVNIAAYNTTMRWFKKSKTVYNPATWGTNVATNFTMSMMDDIPMATLAHAAKLYTLYQVRPSSLTAAEQNLMLEIMKTNALLGDFSSAEMKEALYDAMRTTISKDDSPGVLERMMRFASLEKAKIEKARELVARGGSAGAKFDDVLTGFYAAQDNVFRVASMLNQLGQRTQQSGVAPTAEDFRVAGDHARFAFLDYDIDSKMVKVMRQTAFPFVSWPYAMAKLLGHVAVHKPWKIANLLAGYWVLDALMQGMAGEEDDEMARKYGPDWARKRLFGLSFGPHTHVRIPFLGDDKNPVYYNLGKYVAPTSYVDTIPNGFLGQSWWPSFVSPGGPFISAAVIAIGGVDPYTGKPLAAPTDSNWEKLGTYGKFLSGIVTPNIPLVNPVEWARAEKVFSERTDVTENAAELYIARQAGLRFFDFNTEASLNQQHRAVAAIRRDFQVALGKLKREQALMKTPDWDGYMSRRKELMERMQERINERTGDE